MDRIFNFITKYMNHLIMCVIDSDEDNNTEHNITTVDIDQINQIDQNCIVTTKNPIEKSENINIPIILNKLKDLNDYINSTELSIDNLEEDISESLDNSNNSENSIENNSIENNTKTMINNAENNLDYNTCIYEESSFSPKNNNKIIFSNMKNVKLKTIKSETNMEDIHSDNSSVKSYQSSAKNSLKKYNNYDSDTYVPSIYSTHSDSEFYYSSDNLSNDEIVSKFLEKKSDYNVSDTDITCSETEMKNTCNRLHKKIISSYNLNDSNPNSYQTKHRRQLQNFIKDLNSVS